MIKIGLVLAGGVAKGAYQAGFLQALQEQKGINIVATSCSSIGVLSGYALSTGKVDKLQAIWKRVHFDSVFDVAFHVTFKRYLRNILKELIEEGDTLKIPLYAPICYLPIIRMDYGRMRGTYNKKWRPFVFGALSYPFISGGAHMFRGQFAIDGGAMDNIPLNPLLQHEDVDLIMVLHFEAGFRPRKIYLDFGVPIIDYDISLHNMFRKHSFDFHGETLSGMLDSGYVYGREICSELFGDGNNTLEQVLQAAERRKLQEKQLRLDNVTFETWVQRLNELFYPFVRKQGKRLYEVAPRPKKPKKSKQAKVLQTETLPQ